MPPGLDGLVNDLRARWNLFVPLAACGSLRAGSAPGKLAGFSHRGDIVLRG
jgi:hypothetical protein